MTARAHRRLAAAVPRVRAIAARHDRRVWLLWAVGVAVLVCTPVSLVDPGLLVFALDPELLALIAVSSIAALRVSAIGVAIRVLAASLGRLPLRGRGRS